MPTLDLGADYTDGQTATADIFNDKFNAIEAFLNTTGIDEDNLATEIAEALVPSGTVLNTARSTAPSGYVLCDGTSYSTAGIYATLFAAIGYAYGGSGGNFNVPNLKGKVPVGRDAAQTEFDALAETGGSKTHTLTAAQIPDHSHSLGSWVKITSLANGSGSAPAQSAAAWSSGAQTSATDGGGDQAHNNLQPYLILNYIIKL